MNINDPLLEIAGELENVALNDPYFIERKLYPNVDFYSGCLLYTSLQQRAVNGLDRDLAVDRLVVAQIDHAHGAAPERARELIAADARRTQSAGVATASHIVIRPTSS